MTEDDLRDILNTARDVSELVGAKYLGVGDLVTAMRWREYARVIDIIRYVVSAPPHSTKGEIASEIFDDVRATEGF